MFLALGFLSAALIGLMTLPALSRRADRLARRRAAAAFPLSLDQVAAERDHLRAELALRERGFERKVEDAASGRAAALDESGRKDAVIAGLNREIESRNHEIAGLGQDLSQVTAERDVTASRLASEEASHLATQQERAQAQAEIGRVTALLHERNEEIGMLGRLREGLEQDLAGSRAEKAGLGDRLETLQSSLKALEADLARLNTALAREQEELAKAHAAKTALEHDLTKLRAEKAALNIRGEGLVSKVNVLTAGLEDLKAELAAEKNTAVKAVAEGKALEQAFMSRGQELDTERRLAAERMDERDTARSQIGELRRKHDLLERALRASEQRALKLLSDHQRELAALSEKLRRAEEKSGSALASRKDSDQAFLQLREERSHLKQDLAVLKREMASMDATVKAENAALRREIMRAAEAMLERRREGQEQEGHKRESQEKARSAAPAFMAISDVPKPDIAAAQPGRKAGAMTQGKAG